MINPLDPVINLLQKKHDQAMEHENKALELLASGDKAGYESEMRLKAQALAEMAAEAEEFVEPLRPHPGNDIPKTLKGFSGSASTALHLDSPFYMSALLYNDDHKPGEPDNLILYIQSLAQAR